MRRGPRRRQKAKRGRTSFLSRPCHRRDRRSPPGSDADQCARLLTMLREREGLKADRLRHEMILSGTPTVAADQRAGGRGLPTVPAWRPKVSPGAMSSTRRGSSPWTNGWGGIRRDFPNRLRFKHFRQLTAPRRRRIRRTWRTVGPHRPRSGRSGPGVAGAASGGAGGHPGDSQGGAP